MNRPSFVRTFPLAALSALAVIALTASAGSAQTAPSDPYTTGTTGYDVSYPNCSATPSGAFGIVGVNGGRPFTNNSCLGAEYLAAPAPTALNPGTPYPSLYINTAYSGAYRKNILPDCSSQSTSVSSKSSLQQAWAIGCSEAETSITDATSAGISTSAVAMWWLDVETGNSWSSSNLTLNQYAIQGAVTRLLTVNANVGVYSDGSYWTTITGGNSWTPSGLAADWTAAGGCTAAFTASAVWLAQQGSVNGVDSDLAC